MSKASETSPLTEFLNYEKKIRLCQNERSLAFVIANQTRPFFPYTQALVWKKTLRGFEIIAASSISTVNAKSPYIVWLQRSLIPWLIKTCGAQASIIKKETLPKHILTEWEGYLTDYVLYSPFRKGEQTKITAGVLYINTVPWDEQSVQSHQELQLLYEHAWSSVSQSNFKQWLSAYFSRRKLSCFLGAIAILFLCLFLIPVQQTILAPAEIAPKNPGIVSSSIQGTIRSIEVAPNQKVQKGQALFILDQISLENNFKEAEKNAAIAEERYRKAYQAAYASEENKAELAILKEELAKANSESDYAKSLLERSVIRATASGIVIFSSPKYWLGKPVQIGEQVMLLAAENDKQLDIFVLQKNRLDISSGNVVKFFADTAPLKTLNAVVDYASFVATQKEPGKLEYYVVAQFKPNQYLPQYGAHGTAKIYGNSVSLFSYLFRGPLIFIQSYFGF